MEPNCPKCSHDAGAHSSAGCLIEDRAGYCPCALTRTQVLNAADAAEPVVQVGTYDGATGETAEAVAAGGHVLGGPRGRNQQRALEFLHNRGRHGATWTDLANTMGWHHGVASGVLSTLDRGGKIARLAEKRQRRSVYVLPEFVDGRVVIAPGPAKRALTEREAQAVQHAQRLVERDPKWIQYPIDSGDLKALLGAIDRLST